MSIQTAHEDKLNSYSVVKPTMVDATLVGPVHLQAWFETYINPEVGVDERWILDNMGHVALVSGTEFRAKMFQKIIDGNANIYYRVARDKIGRIVGFCGATATNDDIDSNIIDAIYLLDEAKGCGLGQQMMDGMLEWLGKAKPIKVEVLSYNNHAITFYQKNGFVFTGYKYMWKNQPIEISEMKREIV